MDASRLPTILRLSSALVIILSAQASANTAADGTVVAVPVQPFAERDIGQPVVVSEVVDISTEDARMDSRANAFSEFDPFAGNDSKKNEEEVPIYEEIVEVELPNAQIENAPIVNEKSIAQRQMDALDANPAQASSEQFGYELEQAILEHKKREAELTPEQSKLLAISGADSLDEVNQIGYTLPEGGPVNAGRTLTLEEAIGLAIKNSPERQIADAQIEQAGYALDSASANYYPQATLKAEAGYEYNDPFAIRQGATTVGADNFTHNASGNLRQLIYDGFITRQNVRQRMQLIESSMLSKTKVTEELVKTAVEVYMNLYQFQQNEMAARENLEALEHIAELVNLQIEAGDASEAERNYVAARVASARQNHLNAQAGIRDSYAALTYLTGDIGPILALKPDLDEYELDGAERVMYEAMTRNVEVQLLQSDQEATKHELKANKGRYKPQLALVVDGTHSEDAGGQTGIRHYGSAKLQVTYQLLDGGVRDANIGQSEAKLREIDGQIKRARREIKQKVTSDINKYQTSIRELEITEQEIAANVELEKLYQQQFKQGDIDITNLVESQERIFNAVVKKYKLESTIVTSTFDLLRNMAQILPRFCGTLKGC